jgi:DNA-binding XRE family transcriptional regulator
MTEIQDDPLILTTEQLSKKIGVSPTTLVNWRRNKVLPFMKIGLVVRYDLADVLAALRCHQINARQPIKATGEEAAR